MDPGFHLFELERARVLAAAAYVCMDIAIRSWKSVIESQRRQGTIQLDGTVEGLDEFQAQEFVRAFWVALSYIFIPDAGQSEPAIQAGDDGNVPSEGECLLTLKIEGEEKTFTIRTRKGKRSRVGNH
ncbi:hypothetical protein IAT38_000646 [Cryptococcus sp. DSM 104549]